MDYLPKDPAILVSSVNMLLRDEEFDTLESLCYAFGREPKEIKDYLKAYIPDGIREFQDYPSASLAHLCHMIAHPVQLHGGSKQVELMQA